MRLKNDLRKQIRIIFESMYGVDPNDNMFRFERRGFHIYVCICNMYGDVMYERKFKNIKEATESCRLLKKYIVNNQGHVPTILEKWQLGWDPHIN